MPPHHSIVDGTTDRHDGWVFIAHLSDLDRPRPLLPILIDEKPLLLFRDDEGELGLIGRNCPHRGADLCYGRLENNGIRCPFHGWHFDRSGQCVEQPAEPEGSQMYKAIKVPMLPLHEVDGQIYAYTAEGEPSGLPKIQSVEGAS